MSNREFLVDSVHAKTCDICGKKASRTVKCNETKKIVCFLCIKAIRDAMRNDFVNGR